MKIFYVTNARLPTEKAHGLATVKLCEAFAERGILVTIVAPWRINPLKEDVYAYYQVKRNFKIRFLPSIDFLWLGFGKRLFFLIQLFSFSIIAAVYLFLRYGLWNRLRDTVIFSHDHIPLFFASYFCPLIFYDAHHYPEKTQLYTRVLKRAMAIGVQTKWKIQKLYEDFGVPIEKIVYWPNGTDIERFDIPIFRDEARKQLNLPLDKKIALYTGSLQRWKGVEMLLRTAPLLSDDIVIYIVGGDERDIKNFQFSISNFQTRIRFIGQRPWAEIPIWLKAADVLVLPNTGKMKVSQYYTSPMKLFEYMASARPIVASDIPSIREIADETMVFFAEPDDPRSFAEAIQQALNNPDEADRRADRSRKEVAKYTWEARAQRIIRLMKKGVGAKMKQW